MKAQMLFGMLFMLAVSVSFILLLLTLFSGIGSAYSNGTNSIGSYYSESSNALDQTPSPYSEFHIVTKN
jgi:hypothetical protein